MSDSSISNLPNSLTSGTLADGDLLGVDDISDQETKKITIDNLKAALREDHILIQDEKATTVDGGTTTATTWHTRDLNTEKYDTGSDASISSNQITLLPGTYRCNISAPVYVSGKHKLRLYNITDASTELLGSTNYSTNSTVRSTLVGRFTITASKVFEVQHWVESATATVGLGIAASDGTAEIYTQAEFWKES